MSHSDTDTFTSPGAAPTQRTLRDALDASVESRGERAALAYFDRTFTFAEVRAYAQSFGAWLQDQQIAKGDRVIIQLQNVPQFLFVAAGCWEIGAVVVPVSPIYRATEVSRIAKDSGAKVWTTAPRTRQQQGPASGEDTDLQQLVTTEMTDFAAPGATSPENRETADGPPPSALPATALTPTLEA